MSPLPSLSLAIFGFLIFSNRVLLSGCTSSCQNSDNEVSNFNYRPNRIINRAGRRALKKSFCASPSSRKKSEGRIVHFDGLPPSPSPSARTRPRTQKFKEAALNPLAANFRLMGEAIAAQAKLKEKLSDPEFNNYLSSLGIIDVSQLTDKELETLLTDFEISKEEKFKSNPICTENKPAEQK